MNDNAEENELTFCKIKIDEFTSSSCLPSDVFIRIGKSKAVQIAREGSVIDLNRIEAYRTRSVDHLLVRSTDFHKYAGLNMKIVRAATTSPISREKNLHF